MQSYFWNFIDSNKLGINKKIAYIFLVLLSIVFSAPRYSEIWFLYTLLAYPVLVIGILELTKRLISLISNIRNISLELIETKSNNKKFDDWWDTQNNIKRLSICLTVAAILAFLSLYFNANHNWQRFTDALGIFYIGFMVGDIFYLLLIVQKGIYQLKEFPLKLNPLNPANTVSLRKLAEVVFAIAILMGYSLLVLNAVVAFASYLFPHLLMGVVIISALAWVTIIILSIYPHLIFWQLVQTKKQETLQMLEDKLFTLYLDIKKKNVVSQNIEEFSKLQSQIMSNRSFPISNSELFSVTSTLLLNLVPLVLRYLKIDLP